MNSPPANVVPITQAPKSRLSVALAESVQAYDLAPFIYAADQRIGRAEMGVPFERLSRDAQEKLVGRAAIAIRLGDELKAVAVTEHAAMGIVCDIRRRIRLRALKPGDPETAIDLTTWRRLSKLAMLAALDYLAGVPRVRE